MDGSKSRKSDIAATRKRRSSILKSQRPPRTPFSEVEFNVATPPDAAKSRRVSFSRRNGVAEFEITEATTAWKNVYEEHNKSMESSVNEPDGKEKNAGRRVGHLGSRLTDFQCQDTEAEIINTGSRDQLITSFSVDTVATTSDDKSISAPNSRDFEFTEFTEQQTNQLFGNDANPLILETSDNIEVDFSAVAPMGNNYKGIDNVDRERKGNTSYVDVDLNSTHFSIKAEASMSDMSITDTIHSPKVAASRSAAEEKKSNDSDWVADKENIVVNPYVAPQPADNFAVSDEVDDVLVFDGKKCKFQSNLSCITSSNPSVGDVNHADLKPHITQKWKTIVYDDDEDISITQAVPSQVILPMQSAESRELADIVYDDDFHISMTQAVSSNVILSSQLKISSDKQKTVFFDDLGDITVTQSLPSNILSQRVDASRKSIVYKHDDGNISMTECISAKIIPASEMCGKTILFKDEDGDISMTQAIPDVFRPKIDERRKPTADENVDGHISMTEAMPANIISEAEVRSMTILYKNEDGDISITEAVPSNALRVRSSEPARRRTIVYDDNAADISMTQAVNNVILQEIKHNHENTKEKITYINTSQPLQTTGDNTKRRTILFSSDQGDVSITQALPANLIVPNPSVTNDGNTFAKDANEKVSDTKTGSVDLANPKDILNTTESILDEDGHVLFNVDRGNVKMTATRKSIVYNASNTQPEMSLIEDMPMKNIISNKNMTDNDENLYNMSITKPIPTHMISIENELDNNLKKKKTDGLNGGNYSAGFNQSVIERGVVVFDAAIKLDILKEDPIEDIVSVNSKTSSPPSKRSDEQKPEIIEEEEDENSSAESMIEVRSGSSSKDCYGDKIRVKINTSILNDLLDMTNASRAPGDAGADDNDLIVKSNSDGSSDNIAETTNLKKPTESYLIIKDSDEEQGGQAQSKEESISQGNESPLSDNSKKIDDGIVGTIRNKLGELRDFINRTTSPEPKYHALSGPPQKDDVEREEANTTMGAEMPVNSNDTKAILDLLSQFTDDLVDKENDDNIASPLKLSGHVAIEYNIEPNEPQRRSLIPDRKSMVRCREDLLKDISMAQAMMKYESDETDEVADDSPGETHHEPFRPGHGTTCGNEVVKHLKFDDDDSVYDGTTQQPPVMYTPLKKTAFGETAYMQDQDYGKAKVIPGYLTNLSEELKQVMNDLTKPMVNDTPHNKSKTLSTKAKNSSSTCSTQIQANLIKSSQIDLDPDMLSCSPARSQHGSLWGSAYKPGRAHPNYPEAIDFPENYKPGLIVFDHRNPLNNVLLPPIDAVVTHRYNPRISDENMSSFALHNSAHDAEPRKGKLKRNTESRVALYSPAPAAPLPVAQSDASDLSHPVSVDQAVGVMQDLKDTEANTVIAMKGNKELLETSSSLTLVDDAPSIRSLDYSSASPSRNPLPKAAVQVIYHIKEQDSDLKMDSDVTSNDEDVAEVQLKAKKRIYSPQKSNEKNGPIGAEVVLLTPKPASKVQKVSSSPKLFKKVGWMAAADCKSIPSRTSPSISTAVTAREAACLDITKESDEGTKPERKSGTVMMIEQFLEKYESSIDQKLLTHQIMTALNAKSTSSSCTTDLLSESAPLAAESPVSGSRPNLYSDSEGMASELGRSDCQSRADWHPELIHEMSSKNLVTECESGVNVVAKIDVLPFMGSSDCEWESRGADVWSFRLLRARLRLVVRLEHRHENASRTRVRADTFVRSVLVEQPPLARKENCIAALCVKFAAEAMRYFTSRACLRAGDVPALLRRCAGVARVAVRWGRAMHTARAQLAYTLSEDGALSLKVANIPLRSVWEVTMRVELVVADARETPWPRACHVRVARVVSEWPVREHELHRVLQAVPADWGHVPRAVWKIFKYLKNRTVDDDLLIGL